MMEPTPSPQDQEQDQEILEILKVLGSLNSEYPPDLLAARRAAFVAQVEQKSKERAKTERAAKKQFVKRLEELKSVEAEYPSDLLAARRAAFLAQIEQLGQVEVEEQPEVVGVEEDLAPEAQEIIGLLQKIKTLELEYSSQALATRRAAFLTQVEQLGKVEATAEVVAAQEEFAPKDQEIIRLLKKIKLLEPDYSPRVFADRRAAFMRQIQWGGISLLDALRSAFRNLSLRELKFPTLNVARTSVAIATLIVTAFISSLLFRNPGPALNPAPTQGQIARPSSAAATSTEELATVICKPGYEPPLCLAKKFDKSEDLTYPGNGAARPAVAKDTVPGYSQIHKAAYVNDGLYGPGASWVSNSPNSWIKIDLGKATTINTVTFGRDRLGNLNDGDPGQFVISVALFDNVYADGDSSNDFVEYTDVFKSAQMGFNGVVLGPETIRAQFGPIAARFVKITFQNSGTAVDEVEVFMMQPSSVAAGHPTKRSNDDPTSVVAPTSVLVINTLPPTETPSAVPTSTLAPTDLPTDTPEPADTATPRPTRTPRPTTTPTDEPTNTPRPTKTSTPEPTDTTQPTNPPPPTDTPVPVPTDTVEPLLNPTETPVSVGP